MITLGSRIFAGPFMAPVWSPPRGPGVYAVMAPGWRLLTFRALEFDHAENLSEPELLKKHPKYREWLTIVGTQWNLYIATHDMSFSTPSERSGVLRELAREYRPEFKALALPGGEIDLKTMLIARALRSSDNKL